MATSISPIQSIPCPTPVGISRTDRFRAVDRLAYPTEVRQALGGLDRAFVASAGARLDGVKLSPADAFVLSRLDTRMTAGEIIQITPLPPEAVERSLLRLVTAGAIEPAATPGATQSFEKRAAEASAILAAPTPADVLGVPVGSNRQQLRKAYVALVRRFHPDTMVGAPADLKKATDSAFLRLGAAYEALRSAAERAEQAALPKRTDRVAAPVAVPSPPAEPVPASAPAPEDSPENLLREGEQKLVERPWEALAIAVRVIAQAQGALRRRARLLHAQAQLRNPSTVRAGEVELRSILHDDPTCAEASLVLARFYKDLGLAARAASLLRSVLKTDPRNAEAAAALHGLGLAGRIGA